MPDANDDIDALLRWMAYRFGDDNKWLLAVRALVAERDALRQRVSELEAQPPAIDLREWHDTMAPWMDQVTAMLCHSMTHSHDAKQELVTRCDAAIEAMRKEEENA